MSRNMCLRNGKLRIPRRPTLVWFLNTLYDQSRARVRAWERHSPIYMFDFENVGMISSASIRNGRQCRLLFERPGRDLKKQGGREYTALASESILSVTILRDEIP
jgi:hypothetical protein